MRGVHSDSHPVSSVSQLSPYHPPTISRPSLCDLLIWSPVDLNGNLVVTAVAEPIVKSEDTLRLVRHATAILRVGNTVGLVRRIAQVEVSRPNIAVYHNHNVSHNPPLPNSFAIYSKSKKKRLARLTGDFVLDRTAATVVPERDFVVPVAVALHVPGSGGAHAALSLAHRAVEIVVVPDVDVHHVVESARTPHVRVHANACLCTGCHQDGRGEDRLHFDGVERLFVGCF